MTPEVSTVIALWGSSLEMTDLRVKVYSYNLKPSLGVYSSFLKPNQEACDLLHCNKSWRLISSQQLPAREAYVCSSILNWCQRIKIIGLFWGGWVRSFGCLFIANIYSMFQFLYNLLIQIDTPCQIFVPDVVDFSAFVDTFIADTLIANIDIPRFRRFCWRLFQRLFLQWLFRRLFIDFIL